MPAPAQKMMILPLFTSHLDLFIPYLHLNERREEGRAKDKHTWELSQLLA